MSSRLRGVVNTTWGKLASSSKQRPQRSAEKTTSSRGNKHIVKLQLRGLTKVQRKCHQQPWPSCLKNKTTIVMTNGASSFKASTVSRCLNEADTLFVALANCSILSISIFSTVYGGVHPLLSRSVRPSGKFNDSCRGTLWHTHKPWGTLASNLSQHQCAVQSQLSSNSSESAGLGCEHPNDKLRRSQQVESAVEESTKLHRKQSRKKRVWAPNTECPTYLLKETQAKEVFSNPLCWPKKEEFRKEPEH